MKQFLILIAFACISLSVSAQENAAANRTSIDRLVATHKTSSLYITWNSNKRESNYWEVQGSADGKTFATIGLVMGADPKGSKGDYAFKQQAQKLKPGLKFFRVIHIEQHGEGLASEPIALTK